jgi:hypothetical protein
MTEIVAPISPAELVGDLITRYGGTVGNTLPSTGKEVSLVVGAATDTQQQAGVISLVAAGLPIIEKYIPLQWTRAQIRCLGPDLDTADFLSQCVQRDIHGVVRKLCYQASRDEWFLIHLCNITAGPSMHFDTPETQETLLFAEILLATDPVASGPTYPL